MVAVERLCLPEYDRRRAEALRERNVGEVSLCRYCPGFKQRLVREFVRTFLNDEILDRLGCMPAVEIFPLLNLELKIRPQPRSAAERATDARRRSSGDLL